MSAWVLGLLMYVAAAVLFYVALLLTSKPELPAAPFPHITTRPGENPAFTPAEASSAQPPLT